MSDHEKSEILQLIEAGKAVDRKWNILKIMAYLIPCLTGLVMIGVDIGNWQAWKVSTERRVTSIEGAVQSLQNVRNEKRAEYNKSIVVKNGK